jgi:hypothetical protein
MPCIPEPNNNAGAGVEERSRRGSSSGGGGKSRIGLDAGACFGVLAWASFSFSFVVAVGFYSSWLARSSDNLKSVAVCYDSHTSGALGLIAHCSPGSLYLRAALSRVHTETSFNSLPIIVRSVSRSFSTAAAGRIPKTTSSARLGRTFSSRRRRETSSSNSGSARSRSRSRSRTWRRMIRVRVSLLYKIEDGTGDNQV